MPVGRTGHHFAELVYTIVGRPATIIDASETGLSGHVKVYFVLIILLLVQGALSQGVKPVKASFALIILF